MALHTWHAYRYESSLPLLALGSAATLTARAVRARAIAATLAATAVRARAIAATLAATAVRARAIAATLAAGTSIASYET